MTVLTNRDSYPGAGTLYGATTGAATGGQECLANL